MPWTLIFRINYEEVFFLWLSNTTKKNLKFVIISDLLQKITKLKVFAFCKNGTWYRENKCQRNLEGSCISFAIQKPPRKVFCRNRYSKNTFYVCLSTLYLPSIYAQFFLCDMMSAQTAPLFYPWSSNHFPLPIRI